MAVCTSRTAAASSLIEPRCQPPRHRIDTRSPVRPSTRVGRPVAAAELCWARTPWASAESVAPAAACLRNSRRVVSSMASSFVCGAPSVVREGISAPVFVYPCRVSLREPRPRRRCLAWWKCLEDRMHELAFERTAAHVSLDDRLEREFQARLAESATLAFRVAYAVLRQRQDAEDVAQEA